MTRTSPTLSTPQLAVTFDPQTGLPSGYGPTASSLVLGGSDRDAVSALLVRVADQERLRLDARLRDITLEGDTALVSYEVAGGQVLASFGIRYASHAGSLVLSLEAVAENDGIELIQVDLPGLLRVDENQPGAWLAHGDRGGVHSPLTDATECLLAPGDPGDFPNFSVLPLSLVGHDRVAASIEVVGYLGNTLLSVGSDGGAKVASAGATALYRVPGSATAPSLLVDQPEIARLDFVFAADGGVVSWIDIANAVQQHVVGRSTSYFDDKFMFAILGQIGPSDVTEPENTFQQVEAVIERVWHLTDGVPQVVFVAGWNEGGHDTAYPNISTVNPRLGGKSGWEYLQRGGRERFGANVTLDDNYDDQYDNVYSAGVFDERYLALDRDGSIQTQEAWNGVDMSQITGFAKYLVDGGPGLERARKTIETYRVRDAMLIDAMSWWSVRNDWDPAAPASAVQNLRDGKFKLLDYFASQGVQVGSEVLTYPFVGHLPFTMDGPTGSTWNGFGGSHIPLLALVYRRALIYGGEGGSDANYPDPATSLFHNNRAAKWLSHDTADSVITGMYYLHYLPWMLLSPRDILGFQRSGSSVTITLSDGWEIVIDEAIREPRVSHDGVEIMNGRSVSAPLGADRLAFYAETATTLRHPLPDSLDRSALRVERLDATSRQAHDYTIEGGDLVVEVEAYVPVVASWSAA